MFGYLMNTSLFTNGVNRIWGEDSETQKHYLPIFHEEVRKMENLSSLYEAKAFFVPNDEYLVEYFGPEARNAAYGLYNWEGICLWTHYVMFPTWDLREEVVGFGGFDIMGRAEVMDGIDNGVDTFYKYQSKLVFERGKYIYILPHEYEKAIKDKYILLVDGYYDKFGLTNAGFNAGSLMGSSITEEILFALSFIENVFILEDNDNAGRRLYERMRSYRPNVYYIRQNAFKDSDDVLKSVYRDKYIKAIHESVNLRLSKTLKFVTPRSTDKSLL